MTKRYAVAVAAVVATSHVAEAHNHCREQSSIVGYQTCSRFARWSGFATMWWEFGATALHFDPKPIDVTNVDHGMTYHVTSADDRPITAAGGRFRMLVGIGRTWFFGEEMDFASVTQGPHLIADVAGRDSTMTFDTTTAGFVGAAEVLGGVHRTYGLVTLAGALGTGARVAFLEGSQYAFLPKTAATAWFLVNAHAKADAWVTPNITIGVDASVDLLRRDDYTFGLTLGLHLLPFDRTR